eukprot:7053726-Karenia_brevis.AAC.1
MLIISAVAAPLRASYLRCLQFMATGRQGVMSWHCGRAMGAWQQECAAILDVVTDMELLNSIGFRDSTPTNSADLEYENSPDAHLRDLAALVQQIVLEMVAQHAWVGVHTSRCPPDCTAAFLHADRTTGICAAIAMLCCALVCIAYPLDDAVEPLLSSYFHDDADEDDDDNHENDDEADLCGPLVVINITGQRMM